MPAKFNIGNGIRVFGLNRQSLTNRSSARKFVASDLVQNPDVRNIFTRSNSDHFVDQAVSLKAMSMVADRAAALARQNLQTVREAISVLPSPGMEERSPVTPVLTSEDVEISTRNSARDIFQAFGLDSPGKISQRLQSVSDDLVRKSLHSFLPPREVKKSSPTLFNYAIPEIECVSVELEKKKGAVDCFVACVFFNVPLSQIADGKVKAIRVFRSTIDDPPFMKGRPPLSMRGIERIRSDKNRSRSKNQDGLSILETRLRESEIPNSLSSLNSIDPTLGLRRSATSRSTADQISLSQGTTSVARERNEATLSSYLNSSALAHLDSSVLNDSLAVRNIQVQNPSLVARFNPPIAPAGRGIVPAGARLSPTQLRQMHEGQGELSPLVSNVEGVGLFREIAFLAPDKINSRTIGDRVEYVFEDQSISYGHSYKYYIVTVDNNLNESVRSRIVQADVDGLRVPECPRALQGSILNDAVSLNILVDDLLVEKFEVWRKENDPGFGRTVEKESRVVSNREGFNFDREVKRLQSNNYLLIGESVNMGPGGSMFYDRRVRQGRTYSYRVYSVDVFGNKSEKPREFTIFVPEKTLKPLALKRPIILAEVDSKTHKARVTFECDDPRIEGFFLERRDLSVGQDVFVPPGQVSRIKMGFANRVEGPRKFEGERLNDQTKEKAWPGFFQNSFEQQTFLDRQVEYDHVYQYRIVGVDRLGNRTPFAISKPVFIARVPFIESPVNIAAVFRFGANGSNEGVHITWQDGNQDITAEQRLGNREDLRNNSVKTLYQVERRKIGEEQWFEFPLVDRKEFFDAAQGDANVTPQGYRPGFVELNQRYLYRITALQSGGIISNASSPVEVLVSKPVLTPVDFRVKPADSSIRPFYVMLNWDTDPRSEVVDRWEIERAEVNNFAAARLNNRNPLEFEQLDWKPFRFVYKESSRFRSETADETERVRRGIVGEHYFMDQAITFGNTYFYRIRALSTSGEVSSWTSRGVKVTDDVFERKQAAVLSDAEKALLASSLSPLVIKFDYLEPVLSTTKSDSLLPGFSRSGIENVKDTIDVSSTQIRVISTGSVDFKRHLLSAKLFGIPIRFV